MRRTALILALFSVGTLLLAAPFWEKKDFSQWTADDAKKLLSNSPWAKTTQLNTGKTVAMQIENRSADRLAWNRTPDNSADPGRAYLVSPEPDGIGAGQMTGGQAGGQTGAGQMGGEQQRPSPGSAPGSMGQNPGEVGQGGAQQPQASQRVPVVVEWESAVPIRLAELKLKAGGGQQPSQADVEQAEKPMDTYVIALVGVPGKAQEGEDKEMAAAATITPKDKQAIQATSVKEQQLDNGTRAIVFSFPKSQPISDDDKTVQFKLAKGPLPTEVKQNFKLKDMHYKGQLAL